MSSKALVLSSGGVDSTTCVGLAVKNLGRENVSTVSILYGQKHIKELKCAENVAEYYDVNHYNLDLSEIFKHSSCSLLSHSEKSIPEGSYDSQIDRSKDGVVSTYVPFRNGLMLAAAASLSLSLYPDNNVEIYIGAHADDAAGDAYADCSTAFNLAMCEAILLGTYNKVSVKAPFVDMDKAGVVKLGLELGVPYHLTWSCYNGGDNPCGKCGTCIDRANAFSANGVSDPAMEV